MQGKSTYIPRPFVDRTIAGWLAQGSGVYTIVGANGAGKSAALWHALATERERRGKAGHGHVRVMQLWGDEPPSLFAQRLVREVGFLNLIAYPQPERLARLCADMAHAIPGLGAAGKVLASLVPEDLRPLPLLAAQALSEAGERAIQAGQPAGPLCIGIDLLGGDVSPPVREFFARLCEQLPATVVLIFAHPGGQRSLVQVAPTQSLTLGPFAQAEAQAFLAERLGPLAADADMQTILNSGRLSLLPADLAQIVNLSAYLGQTHSLRAVLPYLERDITARYQMMVETQMAQPGVDARVLELCALCAVTARPQEPLTLERALARMQDSTPLRPSELSQLRQAPLLAALCASPQASAAADGNAPWFGASWPIEPASAQARDGVLTALMRHGLLDVYERRWLAELLQSLRRSDRAPAPPAGPTELLAGVQALSLLQERAARDPLSLGQAVNLLTEMEILLWRAGWHRTFADLYDSLLPHLQQAGAKARDVAPKLWFRRARARIQNVDWSLAHSDLAELQTAEQELDALQTLEETAVMQARARIGLLTDSAEVGAWCRHLPYKARQARGYARVLQMLRNEQTSEPLFHAALDDILFALSHFVAAAAQEDVAQTLTILGDLYSAVGSARSAERRLEPSAQSDRMALFHYEQAIAVAKRVKRQAPLPAFCLGMIYRAQGNHHRRFGRSEQAAQSYMLSRRYLLRSPDARMGSLLASLLPEA